MIRILFVCHGNICRSTMAQFVLQDMVNRCGREAEFHIDSAATSREEIGNSTHPGTVRKLKQEGVPVLPHRAVQMRREDYDNYDYLIGMDSANVRNMIRIVGGDPENKISRLLDFAGVDRNIADPWYTGNFDETYRDVVTGCRGLMENLMEKLKA